MASINFNNLNLLQKSSLAIGCLLSFELILLFFLDKALLDAERDLSQASMAKTIAMECVMVQSSFAECVTSMAAQKLLKKEYLPYEATAGMIRVADRIRSLKVLLRNNPALLTKAEDIEKRLVRTSAVLVGTGTNPDEIMRTVNDVELARAESAEILGELQELGDAQLSSIERSEKSRQSRQSVRQAILTGAALNICVVILLALAFNSGITTRLSVIRKNAQRLAHREELFEPLKGSDEIAEVDKSFHDMARDLREFDQLKSQFFASVSHDIRSPLNSVHATIALLAETDMFELPEGVLFRLKNASQSCARVVQIVTDLLDLEKLEEGQLELHTESMPLDYAVENAISNLLGLLEQKQLTMEREIESLWVEGDSLWLTQVLTNLLSNAIKVSPDGGRLVVRSMQQDNYARVEIQDQGPGLSPEDQEKIFGWFKQTAERKQKRGSSGLGLAIAKKIIEQHKGKIGVQSIAGGGATFWFTVPLEANETLPGTDPHSSVTTEKEET